MGQLVNLYNHTHFYILNMCKVNYSISVAYSSNIKVSSNWSLS